MGVLRRLRRPRLSPMFFAGVAAAVVGCLMLVTGLGHPRTITAEVPAYTHSGQVSYSGHLRRSDSELYPTGSAKTGMPIFLDAVDRLKVVFRYGFDTRLAHVVHGSIVIRALVRTNEGWQNPYVVSKPVAFTGDRASTHVKLDLERLSGLLAQLSQQSGSTAGTYDLELQPEVKYSGVVDGRRIRGTLSPSVPFTVSSTMLKLNAAAPAAPPGASYKPPSAEALQASALNPTRTGRLGRVRPNVVRFAVIHATADALRLGGVSLLLASLLLVAVSQKRRRREIWSEERRIAFRAGVELVEVAGLELTTHEQGAPTTVPAFESLVTLARQSQRPILQEPCDGAVLYTVDDPPRLYVHRAAATSSSEPPRAVEPPAQPTAGDSRRGRLAALGVFLAALATCSAIFTAGNVVPASYAGKATIARTLDQLKPVQCAALHPTTLIVATSSSTTGTGGSDLILGRQHTGSDTLNGGGGDDCMVGGGGGATSFTGGSKGTDICLGSPTSVNTYSGCEIKG
jgi:hypothetical protein